ncbi:MAG: hypothetical protein ETSY2_48395 [Candidatus Entotheonella gemina]|uniref:Peptidase A2 domain-containing protein n=1 Tax=Candidatus Entotheonella gemina TaxID=1429439 RepID=W4LC55_9BACT|nr:MAG: hypothetical protein ETSY2_48395 [Candidatus Entotheonella gemina]
MQTFEIDPSQEIPLVTSRIYGPRGTRRVQLVFDTGAGKTQFHTPVLESIGYSATQAIQMLSMSGPAGPIQEGYSIMLQQIRVLGKTFAEVEVGVFDFDSLSEDGIDGLLGFDLIREFHLEMNGPRGELIVY